jgi:hypothetical protein
MASCNIFSSAQKVLHAVTTVSGYWMDLIDRGHLEYAPTLFLCYGLFFNLPTALLPNRLPDVKVHIGVHNTPDLMAALLLADARTTCRDFDTLIDGSGVRLMPAFHIAHSIAHCCAVCTQATANEIYGSKYKQGRRRRGDKNKESCYGSAVQQLTDSQRQRLVAHDSDAFQSLLRINNGSDGDSDEGSDSDEGLGYRGGGNGISERGDGGDDAEDRLSEGGDDNTGGPSGTPVSRPSNH